MILDAPVAGLPLCGLSELRAGPPATFPIGHDAQGRPVRLIVLWDGSPDGVRVFIDRCRHLPVPLDAELRYLSADGQHLECRTHGALFRLSDGFCVRGPCEGLGLWSLPAHVHDGMVHIRPADWASVLRALG